MNVLAIVQARMGSSRLPGKVLKRLNNWSLIEFLCKRLEYSKKLSGFVIATTTNPDDDILCEELNRIGVRYFRGSEIDVLDRTYNAALQFSADIIVRITGDCPLIDPILIDEAIDVYFSKNADYVSNISPPTFPDGMDVEVFSVNALYRVKERAISEFEREHVTPFFRNGTFTTINISANSDFSKVRLTVDEDADLKLIQVIVKHFYPDTQFTFQNIVDYLKKNPNSFNLNKNICRNEGAKMNEGQKLWKRAKKAISGGNMLLSKRPEMHLPEKWPTYFSKTSGYSVWDLEGIKYDDLYLMGVGTNILGYSNKRIDEVVINAIRLGNLSTLNAPEEVLLAEKLLELDPWAGMVRFARTGGEANAMAVRIARAASGRDGVAVCGYHGWHDWYLSANLPNDNNLANHLLPGLEISGVPKSLNGLVHTFNYNDYKSLEELVANNPIGVIKMEVYRNLEPKDNFLEKVRALASAKNIVLIFDECTSGFRECLGGLHKKYSVFPDMAVYGKTLGNGYAISSVVGKEEIMQAAQSTFISSTFWTERIGSVAGLKTLEVMAEEKPWEHAKEIGNKARDIWVELSSLNKLNIEITGLPAISNFTFQSKQARFYKTLITQEMLKHKILAGTSLYACSAHNYKMFEKYTETLNDIFKVIKECEDGREILTLLDGPVCHDGLKRLN